MSALGRGPLGNSVDLLRRLPGRLLIVVSAHLACLFRRSPSRIPAGLHRRRDNSSAARVVIDGNRTGNAGGPVRRGLRRHLPSGSRSPARSRRPVR